MTTLTPTTVEDVAEIVRDAIEAKQTLELVGSGSRRGYGRVPQADATLDLSTLSGVVAYEPAELVLTARPATPMAEIRALLAQHGQSLAFEPPDLSAGWGRPRGSGTLGGALSLGFGGPRRPYAGAARDHFLGFKAVNGYGEAFGAGGRVVKNVTGYDLPKLMAGAMGTLGVLTEVTVKVLPAPQTVETVVLTGLDPARAVAALSAAQNSAAQVTGAAVLPPQVLAAFPDLPDGEMVALIRLEGVAPSLPSRRAVLADVLAHFTAPTELLGEAASERVWTAVADAAPFADASRPLWRITLPPASAPDVIMALAYDDSIGGQRGYLDWGGGLIWLEVDGQHPEQAAALRAHLAAIPGANATLVRGDAALRSTIPPLQPLEPGLLALTRRVKAQFDPHGLFNPGRLYEGV